MSAVLPLKGDLSQDKVLDHFQGFYADAPFVRVLDPANALPEVNAVRGTNFCDISPVIDEEGQTLVVVAAIDNLGKGAAGQAVQIMNRVCGLAEIKGLIHEPHFLRASGEV